MNLADIQKKLNESTNATEALDTVDALTNKLDKVAEDIVNELVNNGLVPVGLNSEWMIEETIKRHLQSKLNSNKRGSQ